MKVAIFNLGYLPSADKSIITKLTQPLRHLKNPLSDVVKGGRIAIMIYYGMKAGDIERIILDFGSVSCHNKNTLPPIVPSTKSTIHHF